jgi:hypothetical protein
MKTTNINLIISRMTYRLVPIKYQYFLFTFHPENDSKHVNRSVDVAFDCNKMDKNASLKHNCMKKSIDSNTPPHCIRQTCSWQENLSLDNQSCHRLDETASVFSKDTRSPSSCILNKAKSKKGAGSTSTASTIIYSDMNNTDVNDESNQ